MPSFRVQVIGLAILVTLLTSVLMREFFLTSLLTYQEQISSLDTKEKARHLYQEYNTVIDSSETRNFNIAVEGILRDLQKIEIAGDFYTRDIKRYSVGIVILMGIIVGAVFLLIFMMITRPLTRLTTATEQLKAGNFDIQVRESRYSPLNDLTVAFNGMVRELNESRERLIEAEKQTIWKEMARAMAHEIKNPLTPIRLAAQRLESKYYERADNLNAVLEKSMGIINEEVGNLQSLVDAFSGFAKMPEVKFQDYNLNQQLQEISSQYSDEATIELDLDDQLEYVYADTMQMKQVLVNLIQNAIQACPGEPQLLLSTRVTGKNCNISIKDQGQGIDPEALAKIFEPYYTTKKKGTGLGLAIVRRIIRQHGGDIHANSKLGEGSTFTISLPCNRENESAKHEQVGTKHG
ncbi:MAG: HAMP domain-containing protein [Candidatus Marinimicrobia bacterium]|nr:HAMP domain-containing protein [Candidatus Neomarinimicrobiota bacterium]MCF7851467.1 HAMP domain-containing protein [Candidatus Neomarinimicrobiota bacterium]